MCPTAFFNGVIEIVSKVTDIPQSEILSKRREQEIVDARCILIYVLYKVYNLSFKQIGKIVGRSGENSSYHVRNFESRKDHNKMLRIAYEITTKKIQENEQLYS